MQLDYLYTAKNSNDFTKETKRPIQIGEKSPNYFNTPGRILSFIYNISYIKFMIFIDDF